MDYQIKVYGTETCPDTSRTRAHLGQRGLDYDFINIDDDADAERLVIEASHGKRKIPVVDILSKGESRRLVEPSNDALDHSLRESHVDEMGSKTTRRSGVSSGGREDKIA